MGAETLRLHVWGTTPTSLPTLDPISLYAASLIKAMFAHDDHTNVQFVSASTSLPRVPLLQVLNQDGETVQVIDDVESIRAFCCDRHSASTSSDDSGEMAAKATALHALLDDQLLDLTLHSLFSLPSNFRTVTAPAYSSVGGVESDGASTSTLMKVATLPMRFQPSIPSRLRNVVETRLTAAGLWGLGGKEASAHQGEADELAARAGIVPKAKKGLGQADKDAVRDEFERSKLVTRAKEVLEVVNAALSTSATSSGSNSSETQYLLGSDKLESLDAKAFAYLAPLLFAEPKLPVDTLARVLNTSYPHLATYLTRLKHKLFSSSSTSWISPAQANSNPPILSSSTNTNDSSTGSGFLSYFWPSNPKASSTTSPSQPQPQSSHHHQHNYASASNSSSNANAHFNSSRKPSSTSPPEDRRLRLGRALWICSALIGLVGYTFASGIVSVQFVDSDDTHPDEEEELDDDDDEEEEEGEDEDEEEEEGWEVQTEADLEDELGEMEMELELGGEEYDDEDEY